MTRVRFCASWARRPILTEVWTPEKEAEYQRLFALYVAASANALNVLKAKGMESQEFRAADAATGEFWVQLRAMQGKAGMHWMA